jgi:uncharacterized membrane protein (DUF2068 family)
MTFFSPRWILGLPRHKAPVGLRTVALFEAAKGLLVLLVGIGFVSLIDRDAETVAEKIIHVFHMNPARHFPTVILDAASNLTDTKLWWYALAALTYSTVRLVEAYGLWHERAWAEWFAIVSCGVYMPIELREIIKQYGQMSQDLPNHLWVGVLVFLVNLGIVIYLACLLAIEQRKKTAAAVAAPKA